MKATIYANYGMLAAEKRCIYTTAETDATVSEPLDVVIRSSPRRKTLLAKSSSRWTVTIIACRMSCAATNSPASWSRGTPPDTSGLLVPKPKRGNPNAN